MPIRAAVYVRVSTLDQCCALQLADLEQFVSRMGWESTGVYCAKVARK